MSNTDIEKVIQSQMGTFSEPKAPKNVSGEAQKNLKKIPLQEQQMAAQEQSSSAAESEKHLKNALWMTKTAATMAPFALAAPFTGGASLPAGAAIMGGAGLASGATKEAIDATEGQNKSWKEVAGNLAWDTVIGAGTEMGLRPIATLGGEFLNAQLLRSAQKSQVGRKLVEDLETQAHQAIEGLVKDRSADVRGIYSSFVGKLAQIPKAGGATGEMLTAEPSGQVGKFAAMVRSELASTDATGVSSVTQKPLDGLITMHSKLNEMMYSTAAKEVSGPVRKAGRELADDLRKVITNQMTPDEQSLFEGAKEITKQKMGLQTGQNLASEVVRRFVGQRLVGAAIGGIVGVTTHSPMMGLAVDAAAEAAETKFAPIILEHLATAEKLPFQKAVNAILKNPEQAESLLKQASVGLAKSIPTEFAETIRSHAKQVAVDTVTKAKQTGGQ
jgi:hypothetical protein